MAAHSVIVVRRTGDVHSCAARWLLVNVAILAPVFGHLTGRWAGDGRLCWVIALSAASIGLVSFLFWMTLPGSTVIDADNRTVKVRENAWRTKTVPFDDIDGLRPISCGTKMGYGLSLRGTASDCLMITDMLDESDAYRREFSLQLLPRIEDMLPSHSPKGIR